MQYFLAVDQGTTGTTTLVVSLEQGIVGRGYREHPQHFPQPGWVEHDPEAIWQTVLATTTEALAMASISAGEITAVGITNQRETVVAWSGDTGEPIGPTIVWQDRRTSADCDELRHSGMAGRIRELTGLPTDPYFSATKISWLLENNPDVRDAATNGSLRLGTIDSWLVWRMTGGSMHCTDVSNASRTMLYDIHRREWSDELCSQFDVDLQWLPSVVESAAHIADCSAADFVGITAPICGIAGDQQSALFGQACIEAGQAKATYGTGAFVLVNSAGNAPTTEALISTIGWSLAGKTSYALEGSVFTAGASVQWLRDGLKIIDNAPDIEPLAASVKSSDGVVVVPSFAGIGAPIWDANARAALMGVTRGTTRANIARATLEAIAFRVRQNVETMRSEGTPVHELRVDGGMAANDLFLQIQADVLGIPVTRPTSVETTSLGAAYLAAVGSASVQLADVMSLWKAERTFEPNSDVAQQMNTTFRRFVAAQSATREFAQSTLRVPVTN